MLFGDQCSVWIQLVGYVSVPAQPPTNLPRQYLARQDLFDFLKDSESSILKRDDVTKNMFDGMDIWWTWAVWTLIVFFNPAMRAMNNLLIIALGFRWYSWGSMMQRYVRMSIVRKSTCSRSSHSILRCYWRRKIENIEGPSIVFLLFFSSLVISFRLLMMTEGRKMRMPIRRLINEWVSATVCFWTAGCKGPTSVWVDHCSLTNVGCANFEAP